MERLMNDLKDASRQETMIQQQVIERGIRDERVLAAMRAVPRDRFFSAGIQGRCVCRPGRSHRV